MHDVALGAGQADVSQTRSSSLRTRVKDVLARAALVRCRYGGRCPLGTTDCLVVREQGAHRPSSSYLAQMYRKEPHMPPVTSITIRAEVRGV
jgi:hypothetical protein